MIKKFGYSALGFLGLITAVLPGVSNAAGESIADSSDLAALFNTQLGDVGTAGYTVLAVIATFIAAMLVWRFIVRKAKKHVK